MEKKQEVLKTVRVKVPIEEIKGLVKTPIEEISGLTYFENGIFLNKKGEVFTLEDNHFSGYRMLIKHDVVIGKLPFGIK